MTHDSRPVLSIIAEGTAAIEGAFLLAGQGLGHGLAAFRSLVDSLDALGAELDGGSTAAASLDLGRMSRTLRAVAARLPADGQVLGRLLDGNRTMMRGFDDLVDDLRMMVIVSRSARLEAAASDDQRASLDVFSHTIDHQVGDVQRRLHGCAAEHAQLTALLEEAARAHLAFDGSFGGRLTTLASELDEALRVIGQRRDGSRAFLDETAAQARGITRAGGTALVSLQVGDNTRQRLEHVHFALERADEARSQGDGDPQAAAVAGLLSRLAEAQLRDTVASFEEEAARILDGFATLGRETGNLVSSGRATYGRDGEGSSFLAEFRARFAAARDIVGACEANRRAVEQAIGALRAMLETLDGTLTTLGETSEGLVIVAMNVGLKAGRLGAGGWGLVTVAGELKRIAGRIALHVESLLTTFRAAHRDADHFALAADGDIAGATSLEAEAVSILAALAAGDARVADVLESIDRTGREFDATVAGAAETFTRIVDDTARLAAAADRVAAGRDPADGDERALAAAVEAVDELLLPLYSMVQERDVHAVVVGAPPAPRESQAFDDWAA